jgi:cell division protein DivIC
MSSEIKVWKVVLPWVRNKYVLTILIFVLWMLLFDGSSWLDVIAQSRRNSKMEREREYYIDRIEHDRNRMKELRTNNENLEKYAREQYLMKKPDEEIFIIMED